MGVVSNRIIVGNIQFIFSKDGSNRENPSPQCFTQNQNIGDNIFVIAGKYPARLAQPGGYFIKDQ